MFARRFQHFWAPPLIIPARHVVLTGPIFCLVALLLPLLLTVGNILWSTDSASDSVLRHTGNGGQVDLPTVQAAFSASRQDGGGSPAYECRCLYSPLGLGTLMKTSVSPSIGCLHATQLQQTSVLCPNCTDRERIIFDVFRSSCHMAALEAKVPLLELNHTLIPSPLLLDPDSFRQAIALQQGVFEQRLSNWVALEVTRLFTLQNYVFSSPVIVNHTFGVKQNATVSIEDIKDGFPHPVLGYQVSVTASSMLRVNYSVCSYESYAGEMCQYRDCVLRMESQPWLEGIAMYFILTAATFYPMRRAFTAFYTALLAPTVEEASAEKGSEPANDSADMCERVACKLDPLETISRFQLVGLQADATSDSQRSDDKKSDASSLNRSIVDGKRHLSSRRSVASSSLTSPNFRHERRQNEAHDDLGTSFVSTNSSQCERTFGRARSKSAGVAEEELRQPLHSLYEDVNEYTDDEDYDEMTDVVRSSATPRRRLSLMESFSCVMLPLYEHRPPSERRRTATQLDDEEYFESRVKNVLSIVFGTLLALAIASWLTASQWMATTQREVLHPTVADIATWGGRHDCVCSNPVNITLGDLIPNVAISPTGICSNVSLLEEAILEGCNLTSSCDPHMWNGAFVDPHGELRWVQALCSSVNNEINFSVALIMQRTLTFTSLPTLESLNAAIEEVVQNEVLDIVTSPLVVDGQNTILSYGLTAVPSQSLIWALVTNGYDWPELLQYGASTHNISNVTLDAVFDRCRPMSCKEIGATQLAYPNRLNLVVLFLSLVPSLLTASITLFAVTLTLAVALVKRCVGVTSSSLLVALGRTTVIRKLYEKTIFLHPTEKGRKLWRQEMVFRLTTWVLVTLPLATVLVVFGVEVDVAVRVSMSANISSSAALKTANDNSTTFCEFPPANARMQSAFAVENTTMAIFADPNPCWMIPQQPNVLECFFLSEMINNRIGNVSAQELPQYGWISSINTCVSRGVLLCSFNSKNLSFFAAKDLFVGPNATMETVFAGMSDALLVELSEQLDFFYKIPPRRMMTLQALMQTVGSNASFNVSFTEFHTWAFLEDPYFSQFPTALNMSMTSLALNSSTNCSANASSDSSCNSVWFEHFEEAGFTNPFQISPEVQFNQTAFLRQGLSGIRCWDVEVDHSSHAVPIAKQILSNIWSWVHRGDGPLLLTDQEKALVSRILAIHAGVQGWATIILTFLRVVIEHGHCRLH